jgi:hypothetical protein
MEIKQQFIVQDWAGNHLFREKVFDSYEDGWDFLLETFPEDEDLQEYYIIPIKTEE